METIDVINQFVPVFISKIGVIVSKLRVQSNIPYVVELCGVKMPFFQKKLLIDKILYTRTKKTRKISSKIKIHSKSKFWLKSKIRSKIKILFFQF